jgi:hypothetical protein
MPPEPERPPDWRRIEDYSDLQLMDRSAFAWELLRRNPGYCNAVAAFPPTIATDVRCMETDLSRERVAAEWGLSFRRRSRPFRVPSSGFLVRRSRPARRDR